MQPPTPSRPGWADRQAALAFYLGLGPLARLYRWRRGRPFVGHHAGQALAALLLLLAVLLAGLLYWLLLSYLLVYRRGLYEALPSWGGWEAPVRDAVPFAPVLLAWLVPWLAGLLLALFGSIRPVPLLGRLARRPRLLRLAFAANTGLLAAAALVAGVAVHASSLIRSDDGPAAAYLLYDDMGVVPRWVMNLGFYRLALAGRARWGPGSVVVAPFSERRLRTALGYGRFLFLGCHGRGGDITAPGIQITPPRHPTGARGLAAVTVGGGRHGEVRWLPAGDRLRFVYNCACDGGQKAGDWERALSPAEVRTFGRLSAVVEHLAWLWTDGPRRVAELE